MLRRQIAVLSLITVFLASLPSVSSAVVKACGALVHVKTAYDRPDVPITTWSLNFAEVPNSRVAFKIGGKGKSCVLVTYSALMQAGTPGELWLQVVLDGKTIAQPGALVAEYNGEGEGFKSRSFTWIFPAVSPGSRSIHMEYKSGNGSAVSISTQSLIVQYR
jgi:hypothetical protein